MARRSKKRRRGSPGARKLAEMQAAALEAARTWHGQDLTFMDVDIGACLVYPVMENVIVALRDELGMDEGG